MEKFFTKNAVGRQSKDQTMNILCYEAGKLLQCDADSQIVQDSIGYNGHAQTELGDLISMMRYYCEQVGIDYSGLKAAITRDEMITWHTHSQVPIRIAIYVARVVQAHHYLKVFGSTLYHMTLDQALADLKALCRYYCELKKWSYYETEKMGEEHYLERMKSIKERGVESNRAKL